MRKKTGILICFTFFILSFLIFAALNSPDKDVVQADSNTAYNTIARDSSNLNEIGYNIEREVATVYSEYYMDRFIVGKFYITADWYKNNIVSPEFTFRFAVLNPDSTTVGLKIELHSGLGTRIIFQGTLPRVSNPNFVRKTFSNLPAGDYSLRCDGSDPPYYIGTTDFDFSYDSSMPTYITYGAKNDGYTNSSFALTRNCEGRIYYARDGEQFSFTNNRTKTVTPQPAYDGQWSFYVETLAGLRSSIFRFTMDVTNPVINLSCPSVSDASNITVTVTENNLDKLFIKTAGAKGYQPFNTKQITIPSTIEGDYYFYATDRATNQSVIEKISIVHHAPKIKFYKDSKLIADFSGGSNSLPNETNQFFSSNSTLKLDVEAEHLNSITLTYPNGTKQALTNNLSYKTIANNFPAGKYFIDAANKAGHHTYLSFYVDHTKPYLTTTETIQGGLIGEPTKFFYKSNQIINWKYRNNSTDYAPTSVFIISEGGNVVNLAYTTDTVTSFNLTTPDNTATNYNIRVEDAAENSAYYLIRIDKEPPRGKLVAGSMEITDSAGSSSAPAYVNKPIYLTYDSSEGSCTYTFNGGSTAEYSSSQTLAAAGDYVFTLTDWAGNKTSYYVGLDYTIPSGTFSELAGGELTDNGVTNKTLLFTWNSASFPNATATVAKNGGNAIVYQKNEYITEEGIYTVVLTSRYGNSVTYTVTIDKTPPTFYTVDENNIVLGNNPAFNTAVVLKWDEQGCTAKLNGQPYNGELIDAEKAYEFTLTDTVGNTSAVYKFQIDRTPFKDNYDYFLSFGTSTLNHWWESYVYVFNSTSNNYQSGTYYSFIDYETVYKFALQRERQIIESGNWFDGDTIYSDVYQKYVAKHETGYASGSPYWIYKDKETGNIVAYFSNVALNEAMDYYAQLSLREKYMPSAPAPAYTGDGTIPAQNILLGCVVIKSTSPVSFDKQPAGHQLYINGVLSPYSTQLTQGSYTILEVDLAGNEWSYTLIIDNEPPSLYVTDLAGNQLTALQSQFESRTEIRVTYEVQLAARDNYDSNCLFIVTAPSGEQTYLLGAVPYKFNRTGKYTLVIRDRAGNVSKTWQLYVSLEAPTAGFTEEYASDETLTGCTLQLQMNNNLNNISAISVYRYDETDGIYKILAKDDYNTVIAAGQLTYRFFTSGRYRVLFEDNFGRNVEANYELWRENPIGKLFADGIQLPNGQVFWSEDGTAVIELRPAVTNQSFYLTWKYDAGYTAEIIDGSDRLEYIRNTIITRTGTYIIRLTNTDGKFTDFVVMIDKTPPAGTWMIDGSAGTNNMTTSGEVSFTWDEENVTATLDGAFYAKGTIIINEGMHTVVLTDKAGNSRTFTITIDRTPPTVQIMSNGNEYANGSTVNKNAYFVWTEKNVTATLNGVPYVSGKTISEEGTYYLLIEDRYGNRTSYIVTIDKTPPTYKIVSVTGEELANGATLNKGFYVTWDEANVTAQLNKSVYRKEQRITQDGKYIIYLADGAGNVSTITVLINTAPPAGILKANNLEAENGIVTRYNVTFDWKGNCSATVNGIEYKRGAQITEEGEYTFILTDEYGNCSEYTITIDKTAPTAVITANGEELNGDVTRYTVSIEWADEGCTALLNGNAYIMGTPIELSGKYTLLLTDAAGNSTTYTFTINKNKPLGTLKANGLDFENGKSTRYNVYFTWDEEGCSATLNGEKYVKNSQITAEGSYTIVLTNAAGVTNTYTFVIDRVAPAARLIANSESLENGAATRNDVYIVWDEDGCTAKLNGQPYNGDTVSADGFYTFVLTDAAGNSSTLTFIIDRSAKMGSIISNSTVLEDGAYTKYDIYFTWADAGCSATVNGEPYAKGTVLRQEGKYVFVLTDAAGNTYTAYCTIDKTAPEGLIYAKDEELANGSATNKEVYFTWLEENCTAELNYVPYSKGTIINSEGEYTIILTDAAGNSTTYTFTILKTPPTGTLKANNIELEYGAYTRFNVTFTWTGSYTATLNGRSYSRGTIISESGKYTIDLTDIAGNTSIYQFTIKKNPSEAIVKEALDNEEKLLTVIYKSTSDGLDPRYVKNGDTINFDVYCEWADPNATATLNGNPYKLGTKITEAGDYTIVLTDIAGNTSAYYFTIKKTPPVGSLIVNNNPLENGGITNNYVTFTWTESGCSATLNGEKYTKGAIISKEALHSIVLTDAAGNTTTYTFEIYRQAPIVTAQAVKGESQTDLDLTVFLQTTKTINTDIIFYWDANSHYSALLNGEEYNSGMVIDKEGTYTLTVTDRAGNTNTYYFKISYEEAQSLEERTQSVLNIVSTVLLCLLGAGMITTASILLVRRKKNPFKL